MGRIVVDGLEELRHSGLPGDVDRKLAEAAKQCAVLMERGYSQRLG